MKKLLIISLIILPVLICAQPTNGLLVYYPFNGNANDESGNGINPISNSATLTTDRFDNVDEAYDFNSNSISYTLASPSQISISVWVYKEASTTYNCIVTKWGLSSQSFGIRSDGGDLRAYVNTSSGVAAYTFTDLNIPDDEWVHLVMTYDGSDLRGYLNGVSSSNSLSHSGNIINSSASLKFGAQNHSSDYFQGKIDDIRIYDRALSQMQVTELYTGTSGESIWNKNGTAAYYDEGNVGIGISNPNSKLVVDGTIKSKEVKVEVVGADYVFEESYELPSLDEVNQFIKANKHLPEVPSAQEMEENGLSLGEMNILLLKKIEELTLHVIDLNERIDQLESEK